MKTMAAGKFKAKCLAVMDEVQARREPIVVTKNGKPVVKVVPLDAEDDPLKEFFVGGVIVGDVMSPLYSEEELDEFFERSAAQLK